MKRIQWGLPAPGYLYYKDPQNNPSKSFVLYPLPVSTSHFCPLFCCNFLPFPLALLTLFSLVHPPCCFQIISEYSSPFSPSSSFSNLIHLYIYSPIHNPTCSSYSYPPSPFFSFFQAIIIHISEQYDTDIVIIPTIIPDLKPMNSSLPLHR